MKRVVLILLLCFVAGSPMQAQEQPKADLCGMTMVEDGRMTLSYALELQTNRQDTITTRYELGRMMESLILSSLCPQGATCEVSGEMSSEKKSCPRIEQCDLSIKLDLDYFERSVGPADSADQQILVRINGEAKSAIVVIREEDGSSFMSEYSSPK